MNMDFVDKPEFIDSLKKQKEQLERQIANLEQDDVDDRGKQDAEPSNEGKRA
jgi:chaperonin cofactor prefoldin